jgi:hypothetical protein
VPALNFVPYQISSTRCPGSGLAKLLPLRIAEKEVIVYGPDVREIARHELYASGVSGGKHSLPEHSPGRDQQQKCELVKERFGLVWTGRPAVCE